MRRRRHRAAILADDEIENHSRSRGALAARRAAAAGSPRQPAALDVVAAENVYGDIARQIGGAHVSVTSILSDPNADPHLYEPGTRNGLAVAQARLVIQNGARLRRLHDAARGRRRRAKQPRRRHDRRRARRARQRTRTRTSGTTCRGSTAIAGAIAAGLERADPAHAAAYRAGLRRFETSLAPLRREVARIRSVASPARRSPTPSRCPATSLAAAGLRNLAPDAFTRAIEDGTEPPPQAVAAMDALVDAAPDPRAALQQPGRLADHAAHLATRRRAPGSRSSASPRRCRRTSPSSSGSSARPARSYARARDDERRRLGRRPRARASASATLWDGLELRARAGRVPRRARPERHRARRRCSASCSGCSSRRAGSVAVDGRPAARARRAIGYVPQQRVFDRDLPLRGRDLVRLGLDGHRWGVGRLSTRGRARGSTRALAEVGATAYADAPVGRLSGGEQQRLRVAQALVSDPALLLADEPLLSLDLALPARRRRPARRAPPRAPARRSSSSRTTSTRCCRSSTACSTSPRARWAIGTPDEVLTSETLSRLYGTEVDVLRVRGRDRRRRHARRPARPPRGRTATDVHRSCSASTSCTRRCSPARSSRSSPARSASSSSPAALSFAVHAISELGFTGAAGALVLGIDPVIGMIGGSLARRARARAALAARARARQRDRRGARVRARRRRALPLALPGLRDRGDEPALRQHRRRQRRAAARPRDRRRRSCWSGLARALPAAALLERRPGGRRGARRAAARAVGRDLPAARARRPPRRSRSSACCSC